MGGFVRTDFVVKASEGNNVLTIYYYYFRKWIIEFKNRYYPKRNITKRTIQRIISKVVPRSEEENNALMFWKKLYSGHFYSDFIDLFIEDPDLDKNIIKRSKEFRNRVINEDINFYNVDISEEFILDKKYDVIYTSNIHDYITYKPKIERYRDNVYDLLKPGGIVISSNLSHGVCNANELGLFSSKFNYEILDVTKVPGMHQSNFRFNVEYNKDVDQIKLEEDLKAKGYICK